MYIGLDVLYQYYWYFFFSYFLFLFCYLSMNELIKLCNNDKPRTNVIGHTCRTQQLQVLFRILFISFPQSQLISFAFVCSCCIWSLNDVLIFRKYNSFYKNIKLSLNSRRIKLQYHYILFCRVLKLIIQCLFRCLTWFSSQKSKSCLFWSSDSVTNLVLTSFKDNVTHIVSYDSTGDITIWENTFILSSDSFKNLVITWFINYISLPYAISYDLTGEITTRNTVNSHACFLIILSSDSDQKFSRNFIQGYITHAASYD